MDDAVLGFPVWVRATHWINVLFIGFLIRAGIQILGAYPRLYWNDHCTPGTEWLTLTKKRIPRDRLWIALEQEEDVPAWLAQPGGNNLGLGRHWHFFAVIFWVLNGLTYVILLFVTGQWRRLIPTSWSIFPDAWQTFVMYATFHRPPASASDPFDPLQQLTYAAIIFLLAPLLILTGLAQSPAIGAQFPWYPAFFGGRQKARSFHFLGLVAFVLFIIVHVTLVAYTDLGGNFANIIFGQPQYEQGLAVAFGLSIIALIGMIYVVTVWRSRRAPRSMQRALGAIIGVPMSVLSLHTCSRQHYPSAQISPYLVLNGYLPDTPEYLALEGRDFQGWRLEVYGLVAHPLSLTLGELQALPQSTQITKHHCIQGWCGIAEWTGVPLDAILERCRPLPQARYAVFHSYQLDTAGHPFYETLDIRLTHHAQTLLAHTMNGGPLPVAHGAPLRLRVETQLGFKMVKWLRGIEFVADYRNIDQGQGGSREDHMYYEQSVSI